MSGGTGNDQSPHTSGCFVPPGCSSLVKGQPNRELQSSPSRKEGQDPLQGPMKASAAGSCRGGVSTLHALKAAVDGDVIRLGALPVLPVDKDPGDTERQ